MRYRLVPLLLHLLTCQAKDKAPAALPSCPILFEGRVPPFLNKTVFDTNETPFYSVKPLLLKWAYILDFPAIQPSIFDREYGGKPLEITITDLSIIMTNKGIRQTGYRRSELIANENGDAAGVKTYHWSVKQGKPLDVNHEYVNVFLERKDGSGSDFAVALGDVRGTAKSDWKVIDREGRVIWTTPLLQNEWQNFAVKLDYSLNSIAVFYSQGYEMLTAVTQELPNQNALGGQFHFGILKKSKGAKDEQRDGYHETNIRESQIYGGIFIEDSKNGCVSPANPIF